MVFLGLPGGPVVQKTTLVLMQKLPQLFFSFLHMYHITYHCIFYIHFSFFIFPVCIYSVNFSTSDLVRARECQHEEGDLK